MENMTVLNESFNTGNPTSSFIDNSLLKSGTNIFNEIKAQDYITKLGLLEDNLTKNLEEACRTFLQAMGLIWGSPNALRFFENFTGSYQGIIRSVEKAFDIIAENFNIVAQKDAETKGAVWAKKSVTHGLAPILNVSQYISEKLPDGIGIKSEGVTEKVVKFQNSIMNAINECGTSITALSSDSGLVGVKKLNAFSQAGEAVQTALIKSFDGLIAKTAEEVARATEKEAFEDDVVTSIQTMSSTISNSFNNIINGMNF